MNASPGPNNHVHRRGAISTLLMNIGTSRVWQLPNHDYDLALLLLLLAVLALLMTFGVL